MAEKTNPLTCKQCGYANEGERVYCHNCGTKLDRSLLPTLAQPEETMAKKRKRIRKAVTPKRGFFAGAEKTFAYTMLSSVAAAALLLMAMEPDYVPAMANKDDMPRAIAMDMEDATQATAATKLTFTQDEINPYLQYTLKAAASGFLGDSVKFERVFVDLDEGVISITTEQKVFGHSIYCTIYYSLDIKNNKLEAIVKGGSFGRLRIHPNLMKNFASIFQKVWDAAEIKRDSNLLGKSQSIEIHKGSEAHKGQVEVVLLPESMQ